MADDKLRATPAARKLADDLGINLYDVSGSGANGRVHKEDVETYKDTNVVRISPLAKRIALEHNIAWQEIQGTGHRGKIMKKDVLPSFLKISRTRPLSHLLKSRKWKKFQIT